MHEKIIDFIRDVYSTNELIPLHAPTFLGNEKKYLSEVIDSTFVSSNGPFIDRFESSIQSYTKTEKAVSVVSGTAALHSALFLAGVKSGDLVITQALTFVATCNALFHMGVTPVFVDVSEVSLGLCPKSLEYFLDTYATLDDTGGCIHKPSGSRISAVVPVHTFGHPVELDELVLILKKWNIPLIEDAAESLGSFYKGRHTGTMGRFGAISFNGNKIITTGGGGMILCQDKSEGVHAKHVTSTAKVPHPYEFYHDEPGFNYRMPNLNAALGCGQLEALPEYLIKKRELAHLYEDFFSKSEFDFVSEPSYAESNYWLNAVICPSIKSRKELLEFTNEKGIMTRPAWTLMHKLPAFSNAIFDDLSLSEKLESRLVNLPSTPV